MGSHETDVQNLAITVQHTGSICLSGVTNQLAMPSNRNSRLNTFSAAMSADTRGSFGSVTLHINQNGKDFDQWLLHSE